MPLRCLAAQRLLFYNRRLYVHSLIVILSRARTSLLLKRLPTKTEYNRYKNGVNTKFDRLLVV